MIYKGMECTLDEYVEERKKEMRVGASGQGYCDEDFNRYWNEEGMVWAVLEYHGSMGEFSEADIATIERLFGERAGDIFALWEEE